MFKKRIRVRCKDEGRMERMRIVWKTDKGRMERIRVRLGWKDWVRMESWG